MPCTRPWYSVKHGICHSLLKVKRQKAFEDSSVLFAFSKRTPN